MIVQIGATVDHDDVLEDGVQVCPGAHLAAGVTCGDDAFIGTGASIILWRHIGARVVIAAGAVVIADVPLDVMAVGSPAKIIKHW